MADGFDHQDRAETQSAFNRLWSWFEAKAVPTAHAIDPLIGWTGGLDVLSFAHMQQPMTVASAQSAAERQFLTKTY
ncbi:hypothetical protein [Ketogulonicigenium vulgare]|uniref:Uncharacterized protein n=1 Tax=Ketogulonicigenium vulgare (strain WSH-001) TaxID=759362 RepID=F9Y437_KETVW|nr:hypothetical protein [Ketogulonicigenium vulgare]ADO42276.1 hypothetical protein EIO_1131 [Ketogulonicigenium vulgare Y25]AEM40473.1 hypothetical protein KVU_0634 [Ketogulonicigenium vulgare WSH-001]ALJ80658.1 hypothetical protein KVH_05380 [Ketogulonicigenium vulgare]ANW34951.1 hypothetical protein KvSKV_05350 [Ketogulonicigenium vulgare]AOZ54189.1 hypothetical protein KVC_1172 [Ketogulonicigenium vulgare]